MFFTDKCKLLPSIKAALINGFFIAQADYTTQIPKALPLADNSPNGKAKTLLLNKVGWGNLAVSHFRAGIGGK